MRLDVWLVSFDEGSTPAKTLAGTFGIPLRDSMMLEWSLPAVVGRDMGEQDAASAVRMLRGIGAKAEARPMNSAVAVGYALPFDPADAARASSMPFPIIEERRDVPSDRDLARVGDELPSAPLPRQALSRRPPTSSRKPLITSRKPLPPAPRQPLAASHQPPPARPQPPVVSRQPDVALPQPPAVSHQLDVDLPQPLAVSHQAAVVLPQPPAVSHQLDVDLPQPRAVSHQAAVALPQPPAASTERPRTSSRQPAPAPAQPTQRRPVARQSPPVAPPPELVLEDEVREPARLSRQPPRDLPEDSLYDNGPPLELERVERPRPVTRRPVHSTRPAEKSSIGTGIGIGPMLPALGALAVGGTAAFFTLRRGQTAMLGTADMVGHVLDGVALACLVLALVFGFAAIFSKRDHFNIAPSGVALILAVGAAFFLNQWRVPTVGPDSELGGEASGLITQSQVTLAGLDEASSRTLVDALREAGAISIRGAAPVGFMGAEAFHALAVELPPGPSSRARIVVAFRAVMARFGGSVTPDPTPDQSVWIVAL